MTRRGDRVLIVGEHPWSGFAGEVVEVSTAGPEAIVYPPGVPIYEIELDGGFTCAAESAEIVTEPKVRGAA